MFGQDEINASLYQRTDELYKIDNAKPDHEGNFIRPAVNLRDIIVLPQYGNANFHY